MLTTKMSTLNNNTTTTSTNFFQTQNDQSLSRSNSIQLPPLSHLLNKRNSFNSSSSSSSSSSSEINNTNEDITITSNNNNNNSSGSVSPHSISRLPSISDLISPNQQQQQQKTHEFEQQQQHIQQSKPVISTPIKESTSNEKKAYAFISHSPATFPSHEPSIDNAQLARRKRRRTSPNELTILQHEFDAGHTPNKARRQEIASRVNMTEKAVQIWFQNKRQALRKAQANDHSIHQTTTITLPEVDVITSPINSTPTKYYENSHLDSFSTSPISVPANHISAPNVQELPIVAPATTHHHHQTSEIRSSPPPTLTHTTLHQLPPHPKPATWTMMTPAKLAPVTPVRTRYQTPYHQLPTPNVMSFRLNKKENNNNKSSQFNNTLPTPSSSVKFNHQKPMMKVMPLDTNARSPSPADFKVKNIMSLTNLNSPAPTKTEPISKKRNVLGDITNTQNVSNDSKPKQEKKKEGEFECVENLLSLRTANWK